MSKTILVKTMEDEINTYTHDNSDLYKECDCGDWNCSRCSEYMIIAEHITILEQYVNKLEDIKTAERLVKSILNL